MKLPQYRQQVTERFSSPGAGVVDTSQARALGQAAQAVSQFAQVQQAVMQREAKTYTTEVKNRNTVEYTAYQEELSRTSESGTEYMEGIASFIEKQKQAAIDGAVNPEAAKLTTAYFDDFSASAQSQAITTAAAMNAKRERNAFESSMEVARTSVYLDPNQYDKQAEYLEIELRTTSIPESEKDAIISGVKQDLNRSRVLGEIRVNPYEAVRKLYEGNEGLSSTDHEAMLNQAVRAQEAKTASVLAEQAKVDKQVEEMEKKLEASTAMDGYELAATGGLTFEWVTRNRSNMSQGDYKFFLGKLEKPDEETGTDLEVYSSLYSMATTDPELAGKIAHDALLNGDLTIGDFNKISGLATSEAKGEIPTAYKQATNYIRSVSRTNELNPPIGAGERYANASDDFNNWFEQNPKATPQESVAKAREIWSSYALVEGPAIVTSAAPYKSTKPKSDMMMDDLRDSARQLQDDFENKRISGEEYKRQQKNLTQWKRYLEGKDG